MKKSLLFLFLLVLGVTQGWAVDYLTLPASGNNPGATTASGNRTLAEGGTYRVETNTTIDGTKANVYGLRVPENSTVTIYIAKGKTLLVRGENASTGNGTSRRNNPGKPAIEVPSTSTLIITGGGTLRVYGGKAASRYSNTTTTGSAGAAPAIGGIGGNGGADRGEGNVGAEMGTVYVRGNVTVRAARGTSFGKRATASRGADGGVPTYAIGGGGGGGAGRKGTGVNGNVGANGTLYVEKTARVIYLNGKRRIGNTVMTPIQKGNANTVTVTYTDYDNSTEKDVDLTPSAIGQKITEYGFININNDKYNSREFSEETEDKTTGFKQVTVTTKKVKNWTTKPNGEGTVYNPKDLVLANGIGESQTTNLKLYANWEENSAVTFNVIHNADELMKFARMVNGMGEYENNAIEDANGILMADINMETCNWVPIGINNEPTDLSKSYSGIFDGNGHVVSNLTMVQPKADYSDAVGRAGLIGYAKGATIKNVVVFNATLYAKWQVAAVCGRLDQDGSKGSITNCGSFGTLSLKAPGGSSVTNNDARVVAGVVTTAKASPSYVSSVWSTFSDQVNNTRPANTNTTANPVCNYVVASWHNNASYNNAKYTTYTQTVESYDPTKDYTWIHVTDNSMDALKNGKLCYILNGNVQGGTAWTQTFNEEQDKNDATRDYDDCPRPTSEGLAVYKDADDAYSNHIYTVSFDANGGKENPADIYVRRVYGAENRTLSGELPDELALEEGEIYVFNGWWTELDGGSKVQSLSVGEINSDMTLYAHWLAGPQEIEVTANEDPDHQGVYYGTFYYGEQAYRIKTSNVVAYKTCGTADGKLTMTPIADGIIPAGEAVILRAHKSLVELTAVDKVLENDPNNLLYGSDNNISVNDIADIPTDLTAEDEQVKNNCYILTYGTNKLGFYQQPAGKDLNAHRAYILLNEQTSVNFSKSLVMLFDEDETTGITEVSTLNSNKAIFNLNGMRLTKLQKGINIVGGKKVLVK